jgi:hypothetical protein
MNKFSDEQKNRYIELIAIKRINAGYGVIAEITKKPIEEIQNQYAKNGGIDKWLADELNITLAELKELKDDKELIIKKEKIDNLFKNQFNSNEKRKSGFGSFDDFYNWYIDQGDKCYYCDTSYETLKLLFDSKKIKSSKFNETLQIEQKDPKQGYTPENCCLACSLCNNAKSDLISRKNYEKYFAKAMQEFLQDLNNNKVDNITF